MDPGNEDEIQTVRLHSLILFTLQVVQCLVELELLKIAF